MATVVRYPMDVSPAPRQKAMSPHRLGLVLGAVCGGWHLMWSLLVLFGWAQPMIDFTFWLHFITPPYHVGDFALLRTALLIVVTTTAGYVFGAMLGATWNVVRRR